MVGRISQVTRITDYYLGFAATYLIRLGVNSGMFVKLAAYQDGVGAKKLAHELGFDVRYVEHFLRAAFALELLDHDPSSGTYSFAPYMDALLADPGNYRYIGNLAQLNVIAWRDYERMQNLLETGGAFTYSEQGEDVIDAVANSTAGLAQFVATVVVPRLPGLAGREDVAVLDVGCGAGGTVVELAKAFPRGRVVGIDLEPRSVEKAVERIRAAGLEDRAEIRLAAAEDIEAYGEFDLVTLIQVLHETKQEVRDTILSRAHASLRPGGLLLIIDEPYPHETGGLREAPFTALMQLLEIFMGNVFLSPEDQKQMLEKAGFKVLSQVIPPPGLICLTTAQKD